MTIRLLSGDCREMLRTLEAGSVHCCVTSPPYWGLRDYGVDATVWGGDPDCDHEWGETITVNATSHTDKRRWNHTRNGRDEEQPTDKRVAWLRTKVPQGQFCQHCGAWAGALGLEPTPDLFIEHIVEVFREVRRVLRGDGVLLMNLGDSYCATDKWGGGKSGNVGKHTKAEDGSVPSWAVRAKRPAIDGLKPKDLIGIPWMAAFALRADGWWLRRDIIWAKPNPMPESATDRPTTAHEYVFLLTKSARYFWDAEAVREDSSSNRPDMAVNGLRTGLAYLNQPDIQNNSTKPRKTKVPGGWDTGDGAHGTVHRHGRTSAEYVETEIPSGRNCRSVWTIATAPFPEAHFATFPPDLAERCIKAGSSEHGCCSICGAPWDRITIKGQPDLEHQRASGGNAGGEYHGRSVKDHDAHGVQNASDVKRRILEGMREKTYDWQPTCECTGATVVPCTVLDPFGGAGTTGLVADRGGRDAILIELNESYIAMTERRLRADGGMFLNLNLG